MSDPLKETALALVESHREVEPKLRSVFFYRDASGEEVRLLEVVVDSPTNDTVMPFRFAADESRGVAFPVVIIELSPEEFDRLSRGELALPPEWTDSEKLWESAA